MVTPRMCAHCGKAEAMPETNLCLMCIIQDVETIATPGRMTCGHIASAAVYSREGTCYCGECEKDAQERR